MSSYEDWIARIVAQFAPPPNELALFLLARIDEDEARARELLEDERLGELRSSSYYYATCWDGAGHVAVGAGRAIAECTAKRSIVRKWVGMDDEQYHASRNGEDTDLLAGKEDGLQFACRALAVAYSDHPDYRDEWR